MPRIGADGKAEKRGLQPIAVLHAHATHAQEPNWFTTAPIGAMQKVLEKVSWSKDEVDLYEINEAFSVTTMAVCDKLGLDRNRVNVSGGAVALGHPIGASGARILVTLLHDLRERNLRRGVAAICIGGGEALALGVDLELPETDWPWL